ncbi:SRPBCC domain-containing protein [Paenibacillus turpanensis]|uniref:SRPBCC domain-containing protein n=1 Tax=Paenibacillus turpanensis TaxID=2689078 RepID=UPI00140E8202|nr:SRPBCC domain-containing protein [Paenibacillus turpanensis]
MNGEKVVGLTQSAGFQVGVRKTFPLRVEEAWELVTTAKGIEIWLGKVDSFPLQIGHSFHTDEGISGDIRVVNQHQNIRMNWKKEGWPRASILQIRTISQDSLKSTISFHQEHLPNLEERDEMKKRWEQVLNSFKAMI